MQLKMLEKMKLMQKSFQNKNPFKQAIVKKSI